MFLVKNTFGVSSVINPRVANLALIGTTAGSSLNRKKYPKKEKVRENVEAIEEQEVKVIRLRSMSARTKSKIRQKLMSFSQVHKKLTFITLTFVNQIEDKKAIRVLKNFLDNATKKFKDFQYVWVAEKQTKNETFKNNIHFHLITNKYWERQKWWDYWLNTQAKHGITPRDKNFKPTSAFHVREIKRTNTKNIGTYLTKYVTKNSSEFECQVWNCSKKISRLYTCFYSGISMINKLEKLRDAGFLGGELKVIQKEYCNLNIYPVNKITLKLLAPIEKENKKGWNDLEKEGTEL